MKNKFEKIDTTRLKKMIQSDELLEESLVLLLKNLKKDLSKIKNYLKKNEFNKISELCHKMKLSVNLISLDSIEDEIIQLGSKQNKLNEKQFILYTQKVIKEIEKVIK